MHSVDSSAGWSGEALRFTRLSSFVFDGEEEEVERNGLEDDFLLQTALMT
jgi:hypothetical protein